MSGHSKWSTIKRQKAASDQKRGKIFSKLARVITMAAREGGTEVEHNFRLRLAVERAKQANMPRENIERAVSKASGAPDGAQLVEVMYEGFAPVGGVAFMVEAVTDNKMRTVAEIKNIIEKNEGTFGTPGSVSYMFEQKGEIVVEKYDGKAELLYDIAIEAGVEDIQESEDGFVFYTSANELQSVKSKLEESNINITEAGLMYKPNIEVDIDESSRSRLESFFEKLSDHDDVQNVYINASLL